MTIDDYLKKPYWLIDILSKQVPANSRGQYFKMERYWLRQPQFGCICYQFTSLLMKLNCYHEISVANAESAVSVSLQSECLEKMMVSTNHLLASGDAIYMVMESENAIAGMGMKSPRKRRSTFGRFARQRTSRLAS